MRQDGMRRGPLVARRGDYVIQGAAEVRVGSEQIAAGPGILLMIPAGTAHHVRSVGSAPLFFLTVDAPPEY